MSPVSTQYSASQVDDDDALVYTMRDLNQQTARILSEIEKSGKPAFITRRGRFVAIITPLPPGQVESRVLAEMAREISKRDRRQLSAAVTARPRWSPALPARP
jgi:antitoxin (DNA-binding transcriptional repressor) of toxin-antitoxin stability system